jgi:hypothetical protein
VAIILIHHNRKAADGDWLNEVSGSAGTTAACDTILTIKRERGSADAVLHATGRDIEDQELALKFDEGRWSILGDAAEHRMGETRRKIFDLIDLRGPKTPKEVAEETGLKHALVKQTLLRMLRDGALKADASGRYDLAKR